jgi:hypothetical protein
MLASFLLQLVYAAAVEAKQRQPHHHYPASPFELRQIHTAIVKGKT